LLKDVSSPPNVARFVAKPLLNCCRSCFGM
jgi:hypothetical protein